MSTTHTLDSEVLLYWQAHTLCFRVLS